MSGWQKPNGSYRKPIELPPEVARAFVRDMRAFQGRDRSETAVAIEAALERQAENYRRAGDV